MKIGKGGVTKSQSWDTSIFRGWEEEPSPAVMLGKKKNQEECGVSKVKLKVHVKEGVIAHVRCLQEVKPGEY